MTLPSIPSSSPGLHRSWFSPSQNLFLSSPNLEWAKWCWPSSGWSHSSEPLSSATVFILFQPCLGSQVIFDVCESILRRMGSDESAGDEGRMAWHRRPG